MHERPMPELILWDFNGTLLDDVAYAIGVRNRVFPRFGLPQLSSLAQYHAQFTFPVRDYYTRAGVTEDQFVAVAQAWMAEYVRGCASVPLFPDVEAALDAFAAAGARQAVLSASKADTLRDQLAQAGIAERFEAILGLSHIYATSKEEIGKAYLAQCGIAPERCVMLGDTLHDAEVAAAMGTACVLVARGHQSHAVLCAAGVPVVRDLNEAVATLLGRKTG